jgi:UDP-glucose 4-epimerase
MGKRCYLFALPPGVLMLAARLAGRGDAVNRLCGNLQIDCTKSNEILDWRPVIDVETALHRMVETYRQ